MTTALEHIRTMLETRLDDRAEGFFGKTAVEIADGVDSARFASLISLASRFAPRGNLEPTAAERATAGEVLEGWNPERWTMLETVRVALVLSRSDLTEDRAAEALEEAFVYADEGELCALYRSLAFLPEPKRFVWRAAEGCRTNMRSVFEADVCDTPFPAQQFDDIAWRQAAIKAIFVEAPLWRVWGLDGRLDEELARMALDLADERRSAGRNVQTELWLVIGTHCAGRALESIERELASSNTIGRCAGALALARAGHIDRLRVLSSSESEPAVSQTMQRAIEGHYDQTAFAHLEPSLQETT